MNYVFAAFFGFIFFAVFVSDLMPKEAVIGVGAALGVGCYWLYSLFKPAENNTKPHLK